MTAIRRVSGFALAAVVALLVGLPFLALAQTTPSIPFAPSSSGGSGGGGCPGPSCDAEYLRLDNVNAADLTSTSEGVVYSVAEPSFGGVGIGLTSDSISYLWAADLGGFAYVMADAASFYANSGTVAWGDGGSGDITLNAFSAADTFLNVNAGASGATLFSSWSVSGGYSFLSHSTTAPSFNFLDDTNTGVGRSAADTLCQYTGGSCRASLTTTTLTHTVPLLGPTGSAAAPAYSFTGASSNSGLYLIGADVPALSVDGTAVWYSNGLTNRFLQGLTPESTTLNVGQDSAQTWDHIFALQNAAGDPSYSFGGDSNTGVFSPGADAVSIAAGGADVFAFTTTNAQTLNVRPKTDNVSDLGSGSFKYANAYIGTVIADKVEADPGTAGAPTLTFGTDTTSGLYLISSGVPAMSAGGDLTTAWGLNHRSTTLDGMSAVGFVAAPVFDYGNANVTAAPGAPATCSATIEGFTLYARDTDLSTNNGALCLCTCASVVANACDSWGWRLPDGSAGRVCDLL